MEAWLLPNVADRAETIETLGRFDIRYPQTAYAGLAMSLQAERKHLMRTVPGFREYIGPVEEALANKFLTKLLGLQSISGRLLKILSLEYKREGLRILVLSEEADKIYQTLQACNERLMEYLLTG